MPLQESPEVPEQKSPDVSAHRDRNQNRAFLLERGVTVARRRRNLEVGRQLMHPMSRRKELAAY